MKKYSAYARFARVLARIIFRKPEFVFEEPLPKDEAVVFTANHSGAYGPVNAALYFPTPCRPWTIAQILDKKSAADFVFYDFFAATTKKCKFFWRILSHIVAFLLRPLLLATEGIPVYHDRRITETFAKSIDALKSGSNLVVFPECPEKFSPHINEFYGGFAKLGLLYYKETGKKLKFYPTYVAHPLKKVLVGKPVEFDPEKPATLQRKQIAEELRDRTEKLALSLPEHSVHPFLTDEWYEAFGQYWEENRMLEYWQLSEKTDRKKTRSAKTRGKVSCGALDPNIKSSFTTADCSGDVSRSDIFDECKIHNA